jgi:hypothetical protein
LGWRGGHLDNGVIPNCLVTFQFRKENWAEYDMQTVRGIMALLNAYPEADAFLVAYDAEHPALLRIRGYLVLARQLTENNSIWDPAREPSLVAMVDLPYTIEPLGPWHFIQTPLGGPRTLSVVR